MRPLVALIVVAFPLCGAEMRIDHVTLAGARLGEMREAFSAATGISTEYGGPHSNHATEMALASFPDGSYLELMGIQQRADPAAVTAHAWSQFLRDNGGPCAFALRVADVNAEIRRLSNSGIRVGDAEKSGPTRPDGVALSWETADIGNRRHRFGATGIVLPVRDSRFHAAREPCIPVGETDLDPFSRYRTGCDRRPQSRRIHRTVPESVSVTCAEASA
jgi:hypothetical protein